MNRYLLMLTGICFCVRVSERIGRGEGVSTKDKLAEALRKAGAPATMIEKAEAGYYDDFEGPLATPINQLVSDARILGLNEIAVAAIGGEFDGTPEEGEAWFQRAGKDFAVMEAPAGVPDLWKAYLHFSQMEKVQFTEEFRRGTFWLLVLIVWMPMLLIFLMLLNK